MVFFSILGTIFKIIGILLLGILLLLLFVLVLLLFVPLRYRAQFARGKEGIRVHAEVNYLFHFIHAPVDFCDGRLKIKFKVFGLTLYPKGKQREKKKDEEESEEKREEDLADQVKNQDSGMSEEDIGETQEKEECAGQEKTMQDGQDSQNEEDNTEVKEREAGRLKTKVCAFIKKLLHLYEKVREILRGITEKISAGKIKVSRIKACAQMVFDFLRDEENKNGIKYTGKSILRLLKHVFPYRIEGDIVFATGDAYSEGRVLSVLGLLYPLYGRRLKISADFTADAFRLEGQLKIKGRVRLGTILWIAFRLWRKGKIMRLISAAKELKHKLMTSAL